MAELSPVARALLETIAGPESKGDYNVIYGGSQFDDFSAHPNKPVLITSGPNKGKYSTAAGKYQFLGSTWNDQAEKLGLTDFSPASQDMAAWNLAVEEYKRDTGRDLEADLTAGDISRIPASLKNQWTSLPGGIEQGIGGTAFANAYASNLGKPVNPAVGAINSATGQPAPKPNLLQAAFQGISNAAAPIMRGAQTAGQNAMPSIMKAALGSVAARTALIDPMIKNIMTGNRSGALGTPPPATGYGSKGYTTIMAPGGGAKLNNAQGVWMGGLSGPGSAPQAHGGSENDKHRGEVQKTIGRSFY